MNITTDKVSTDKETGRQGDKERAQSPVGTTDASCIFQPASLSVLVRPYAPTDYASVLALWEEAKLRPYTERELERLLSAGGGALVAVQIDNNVAGVVLWSHNGSMGILWRLAVAEALRGQGIATKLLDRVEQDIREAGFGGVSLLTRSTNTIARAMYAKRGYHWNEIHEFWGKKLPACEAETGGQTSC